MKRFSFFLVLIFLVLSSGIVLAETPSGWQKYSGNPVLGGDLGVCFDLTMLEQEGTFRMWFSWRPKKAIGYSESKDGIHWSDPVVVLAPAGGWEMNLNRPSVIFRNQKYHMWFTGQADGHSRIGYATSEDGIHWERVQVDPVLIPEADWEKVAVMCPHVLWDEEAQNFRMYFSAGEQYEPNAIGCAMSSDGIHWKKLPQNPIFRPDPSKSWESHKVTAAQVLKHRDGYLMFFIGFENENLARIGIARSRDGLSNWERLPSNPIIGPDAGAWDGEACYKPYAIFDSKAGKWRLWFNGRAGHVEQIGLAIHEGEELFPE